MCCRSRCAYAKEGMNANTSCLELHGNLWNADVCKPSIACGPQLYRKHGIRARKEQIWNEDACRIIPTWATCGSVQSVEWRHEYTEYVIESCVEQIRTKTRG